MWDYLGTFEDLKLLTIEKRCFGKRQNNNNNNNNNNNDNDNDNDNNNNNNNNHLLLLTSCIVTKLQEVAFHIGLFSDSPKSGKSKWENNKMSKMNQKFVLSFYPEYTKQSAWYLGMHNCDIAANQELIH